MQNTTRWAIAALLSLGLVACQETKSADGADPTPKPEVDQKADKRVPLPRGETPGEIHRLDPVPVGKEIDQSAFRARVKEISDDKYTGRAPTTPGGRAASQWVADEMARIGLKPANHGSWFQKVPLAESTLDVDKSSMTLSVNGRAEPFAYKTDEIFWTKKDSPEETIKDSDVVFVGYGVVAPEYGWNDYAGLDVKGKTVVILVNDPGFANPEMGKFNGKAMTYYGRWTYKYEEAGRQGAAAAIIVHETAPAAYPWGVVSGSWSGAQYDLVRPDGGANRTQLEGWITFDAAKKLFSDAGLNYEELRDAAAKPGFKPVDMKGVTLSAKVVSNIKKLESRNVAGYIPGAKNPDEYVLYTAHWDHLGEKPVAQGEDGIYNGAVDNGTGVAGILTIAEAFEKQKNPPDRSILFLSVTAEESGLLGSAYFAADPFVPLNKIVGGFNIDAMLPGPAARDFEIVGYGSSQLEDIVTEKAKARGMYIIGDQHPEAGHFYRSDHISLAKKGVPMLYGGGGEDLVVGGKEAGQARAMAYRKNNYHKVTDEYSSDWDVTGMMQDLELLFMAGQEIAHSGEWPNWYPDNEFRAIRDAQMKAGDANPDKS